MRRALLTLALLLGGAALAHAQSRRITFQGAELDALLRPTVESALAPCRIDELELPRRLVLVSREPSITTDAEAPRDSGLANVALTLRHDDRTTHLVVRAHVTCPGAVVHPGNAVRLVVNIGRVTASAPGVVREAGRIGDRVRVTNSATHASLVGRVVDSGTVEVTP